MPENRKEARNCHLCGLESLGDCEERSAHRPVDEKSPPCKFCSRNQYSRGKIVADFYSENWVLSFGLDKHYSASIEDPQNSHERLLLTFLHATET
jgi:hypothetical protein